MGLSREQVNVAMRDRDHLKRWLQETGRRYIVLDGHDLVDALWDVDGAMDALLSVLAMYRDHRRAVPSGRVERTTEPMTGAQVEVTLFKDETLELDELDRAIRFLINLASLEAQHIGEPWSLDNNPL